MTTTVGTYSKKQAMLDKTLEKKTLGTLSVLKIIFWVIFLALIPIILYIPDVSFGPLDIFRRDFFRTEIILSGSKYDADAFLNAIRNDNKRIVKLFIKSGFDVNSAGAGGETPLCAAAESGDVKTVDMLIDSGADIFRRNVKNGLTPPFYAVKSDNVLILETFVKAGWNINTRNDYANGMSPLHYAAALGKDTCVAYLLSAGAPVNQRDMTGKTPLHIAAGQNNLVVVYTLVNAGAELSLPDRAGLTPLAVAREAGIDATVKLLTRHGAV